MPDQDNRPVKGERPPGEFPPEPLHAEAGPEGLGLERVPGGSGSSMDKDSEAALAKLRLEVSNGAEEEVPKAAELVGAESEQSLARSRVAVLAMKAPADEIEQALIRVWRGQTPETK